MEVGTGLLLFPTACSSDKGSWMHTYANCFFPFTRLLTRYMCIKHLFCAKDVSQPSSVTNVRVFVVVVVIVFLLNKLYVFIKLGNTFSGIKFHNHSGEDSAPVPKLLSGRSKPIFAYSFWVLCWGSAQRVSALPAASREPLPITGGRALKPEEEGTCSFCGHPVYFLLCERDASITPSSCFPEAATGSNSYFF